MGNSINLFPAFVNVDAVGQNHDNYPEPNSPVRYDWFRSYLIGLLSCQSGMSEPFEYRVGSFWFKLDGIWYIYNGSEWVLVSDVIDFDDESLAELYTELSIKFPVSPSATFSGVCSLGTRFINFPHSVVVDLLSKASVYVNGVLLGIYQISMNCGLFVELDSDLVAGDRFTVIVKGYN